MNLIYKTIENYLNALNASEYLVRLIHDEREKYDPLKVHYTKAQFLKAIGYLRAKNAEGYHIYARPLGYEYILLDDLKRDKLQALAELKPCLLLETSPKNYQAWLKFPEAVKSREVALSICKELAALLDADMASAEPDHVGRVPTFTNRKEKYRMSSGLFPFVKLHKYSDRYTNFQPQGGHCAKEPLERAARNVPNSKLKGSSQSEADFNIACMLLRQKKPYEFIYSRILEQFNSSKHKESDYIPRTIRNAAKAVEKSDRVVIDWV